MHTPFPSLAGLGLALVALSAPAADLRVEFGAAFELPPLTAGPNTVSLGFVLDETLAGALPQFDFAFELRDVALSGDFGGAAFDSRHNSLGWFDYADQNYRGIDLRLRDLLVPGDWLQLLMVTAEPLYSGPNTDPTLLRLSLTGQQGGIYYYPPGSPTFSAEGALTGVRYSVTAVPEPGPAALLAAGLLVLGWRRWRA